MRLIDADEIRIKPDFIFYGVCGTPVIRCEDLARIINDMPTIQSEPERKKGKWTATYSDCGGDVWVSWKCSNCGYVRKKGWKYTDDGKKPDALFCEMCNADMRGEWHKKK